MAKSNKETIKTEQFFSAINPLNLIIEKNVTSTKCKRRMVIYDKSNEMLMSSNMRFAEQYDLLGAFDGKCRFEMNLRNMEAIRSALGVTDNSLRSVLSSDSTPLKDFLQDVLSVEPPVKCSDWKEYVRTLVLRDCNFDLAQVEAKVRAYSAQRVPGVAEYTVPG